MMERLRGPWGVARLLRLGLAVVFLWQGFAQGEAIAWFAGLFFGVQAVFNLGCCGTACVAPPANRSADSVVEEVHYEEIR